MMEKDLARAKAKEMVEILKQYSYEAFYADNAAEAKQIMLDMIPKGASVTVGGSVTLAEMGVPEIFRTEDYKFFERYNQPTPEDCIEVQRQGLLADVMVSGANAVTKNGEILFLDGNGNRAAGVIFGPKKVIIVMGANKITDNLEEGMERVKRISPLNAKRLNLKTPCAQTGVCQDCSSPARICNAWAILRNGYRSAGRLNVIMIGEELGY